MLNYKRTSDEGVGVRWTLLRSRSTDRGGNRNGGFAAGKATRSEMLTAAAIYRL